MAYTATALSFMLENLAKPVVFTGAAIPLGQLFNDAERNLVASLYVAAQADIPEVVICFSNKLTRANRTTKFDNWAQNSFESPNYPFLGRIGTNLSLFRDNILNPPKYKFLSSKWRNSSKPIKFITRSVKMANN
ncbi:hypothetical protein MHBO_004647 [Bonamia ostreae]|uniref:L-asparaginase N-terminal domain-containing protein n=1 Tax=Bonamia ostreae TaxID=126728 RepID=A0ABV2AUP3_9EUKA